jgi:hypothetical protein
MYSTSSGGPSSLSCFALTTSFHVTVSRPSPMALIRAMFTMSWMLAPVAYGVMVASLSTCSGVSSRLILLRYPS